MKKLLIILFAFVSLVANSQSRSLTQVTYMSSTGYKAMWYQPPGRDTKGPLPFILVGGGSGTRGTDPQIMLNEGLMKWINAGNDIDCYILAIQVPTSVNAYADSHIDAGYNWATVTSGANIQDSMVYATGLSFGASMTSTAINSHPERWAAAILMAGNTILRNNLTQAQINVPQYHFAGSYESFFNNHVLYLDSSLKQSPKPVILPEMRAFYGGHSSTVWDAVYGDFHKWAGWLKLHHLNRDTTAKRYVDSLEVETVWEKRQDMYWKSVRLVQFLSASAHKTSLQSRLATEYSEIYPGKYVNLDFGLSTNPSAGNVNNLPNMAAGTSYTNLISAVDGSNTGWSFTINSEGAGTEEAGNGFAGSYHFGLDSANGFIDQWWNFNAGGNITIGGLDPDKTYTIITTGMSRKSNQSQRQGVRITINGVQKQIETQEANTDQYITFTGLVPNASGQIVAAVRSHYAYEAYLSDMQIVEEGDAPPPPAVTVTVPDIIGIGLKQSTTTTINPAFTTTGNISSYSWTKLTGASGEGTIANSTSANPGITFSLAGEGVFTYRLTVSDGTNTAFDDFTIQPRNWQNKNKIPCREGAPVVWTLNTTYSYGDGFYDLKYPNLLGSGYGIQGGDTIKIKVPVGGKLHHFYLGGFGGSEGCDVQVVPDSSVVEITGTGSAQHRVHFAKNSTDVDTTTFINHVVFDGTYLRNKTGDKYGFKSTGTSWGMTVRNATDVEIKGWYFENNSLGISFKMFSDSTVQPNIYDNFIQKNIKIHDNYFKRILGSEGQYIGQTDPAGNQAGNDGPTPRMDSVFIYDNFIDSSNWDAIQASATNYTEIHDNIVLNPAVEDSSSQNWGILMGGLTTGKAYNNITYNGKSGTIGSLGYGNLEAYNNGIFTTLGNGMYFNQTTSGVLEYTLNGGLPGLKINVHHNIISDVEDRAVRHQNNSGLADVGVIENNYFVDDTKTLSELVLTNAGDVVNNNTVVTSFPVTIENIGSYTIGPRIKVTQGAAVDTFTTAKEAYDWLWARISGSALPNIPPTANAGGDQTITLPVTSVTLNASGSTDADGTISTYLWELVSGPNTPTIVSASNASTNVTGLIEGEYHFMVTVTDNDGAENTDEVIVTVRRGYKQIVRWKQ